jgi:putative ABC transport system substrate-binding protein
MRRREFITLLAGAVGWPVVAHAQQKSGMRTVGVILSVAESDPEGQARIAAFRQAFADLGWKEGQNVHIEYRWTAGKMELVDQYAKEIVALAPNVIVANSTPVVAALQQATRTIPIVCALVSDPVGLGFVQSLAHPGGNITGFTYIDPDLVGKWLGLLKDADPALARAALLFNPVSAPFYENFLKDISASHQTTPIKLIAMPVGNPEEMETALSALARQPGSGLMIGPDSFNIVHIEKIAQLAAGNRLPAISVYRPFAEVGGLMSYGPDTADIFRQSASYVDRILKGARAADLPVQQPIKFEFVINQKAANGLALKLPPNLLSLADAVIE